MNQNDLAGVVIVAAGTSSRMGGIDKVLTPLGHLPLILHTINAFEQSAQVAYIVLVVATHNRAAIQGLVESYGYGKLSSVCIGGERRQDSVAKGLKALPDCNWVIVHDGARPFVTQDVIEKGLKQAKLTGSAVPVVPLKDTIKWVDDLNFVQSTPDRKTVVIAQTPQVFKREILENAYSQVGDDVTDDATMVEKAGGRIAVFEGSYRNIKVTTPEDLKLAELIISDGDFLM